MSAFTTTTGAFAARAEGRNALEWYADYAGELITKAQDLPGLGIRRCKEP